MRVCANVDWLAAGPELRFRQLPPVECLEVGTELSDLLAVTEAESVAA